MERPRVWFYKMKTKLFVAPIAALAVLAGSLAPMTASAQSYYGGYHKHRQAQKDQWKNLGIASGVLGVIGLLSKNSTLGILGAAGAAYSAYRYGEDGKGHNR